MAMTKDKTGKPDRKAKRADREARDMKGARQTAGLNVAVSVVAAAALLLLINFISNRHSFRRDMETLGRYGLSGSAKRILDDVEAPIALTSIYTSAKPDRKPEEYLPRLRDLLDETADYKGNVSAVNVTSDRQKAEVLGRLRERLDAKAKDHRLIVKDFQLLANTQAPQYKQMAEKWKAYPPAGWLSQFGVGKAFEEAFQTNREELTKVTANLRLELAGASLPDYPVMVDEIKDALEKIEDRLKQIGEHLRQLQSLPEQAGKSKAELVKAAAGLADAIQKATDLAGKPGSAAPSDPSAALDKLAKAASAAGNAAQAAITRLNDFNTASGGYVKFARAWRIGSVSLPQRCAQMAASAENLAEQAGGIRAAAKVEVQKEFVTQLRPVMPQLVAQARNIAGGVDKLLTELTVLDKPTQAIFEEAKKEAFLQTQAKPIRKLLDRVGKLEKLEDQKELIEQVRQDNIVLVEVGEKAGVIPFEDVWPQADRPPWDTSEPDEKQRRIFNGDTAISAKILSMASESLGEVVLTFFEDIPPPFMRQQRPPVAGQIPSIWLRTLRERLEKANLKVTEWNLAREDQPPEAEKGDSPRVLLVLPPPEPQPTPPMRGQPPPPGWSDEHLRKISALIDQGVAAVFLAGYFESQRWGQTGSPPYLLAEYLNKQWGLDVKTGLRVVQAEPDLANPGTYELPVLRWTFMPLSTFTDHPIGKPLKARRMYWLNACPILRAEGSEAGSTIEDILIVRADPPGSWAAADPRGLASKMFRGEGRGIVPGSAEGDLMPPFAVAVAAHKKIGEKTARIAVLGVGMSYIDQFLNSRIPRLEGGEMLATDPPPTGDVDLMVNSVYHLIGKAEFIGAGPAAIPRIEDIGTRTMVAVKIIFGLLWPLALLVAGGVVMMLRKR